ncbi:uncharacterized protein CC84DRAFT_1169588 [Paraphaeosphaeria sporulosa]|uniref:EthD domain-containing protein n=1 Tax=Paraphaeosphaeria sporulosa TaxID=1460663 RepID=A0A177BX03_9PLEO|nr:uncharacterized protein CC84DRAFT_1169588 [Paraphaeosphaeria sporulosa]OAF99490.1 hypothetical protein CC84DRAFT_1169588 [Paraphaeosphaeria sporulosa]
MAAPAPACPTTSSITQHDPFTSIPSSDNAPMLPLFTVLIFGFRAPNTTIQEYRNHYDNVHVPLAKSLTGAAFPISHTRHYFGENATLAAISAPVQWDSLAVLTFKDDTHAGTFNYLLSQPEAAAKIHADEKIFMADGSPKMVVIGKDTSITEP